MICDDRVKNKRDLLFIIKYMSATFCVFFLAFVLLKFPDDTGNGIREGIELCLYTLIPSLFPFMVLFTYSIESGLGIKNTYLLSKITKLIFRFPGECAAVIICSCIGGLPVGAKMTENLYEKGIISRKQGQRLLLFCINPGPAFVISYVGMYLLGSKKAGIILYVSVILSNLIIGILTGFLFEDDYEPRQILSSVGVNYTDAFRISLIKSSKTLLEICAWVVLFSCIGELCSTLIINESVSLFLKCILEITNGCKTASGLLTVPMLAAIIGFSGICAHFQVSGALFKLKLKYKYFFVARVISGGLAVIISGFLLDIFPITVETISLGVRPEKYGSSVSVIVSVSSVLMALLFLLGDDYKIKNKNVGIK